MNRVFALTFLLLFAGACQQAEAPASRTPPSLETLEEAVVPEVGKPMLPAYKVLGDFKPLKADEFSDYRDAHPELYAITNPPTVGVRPVAEYEDAARLMITVSSNTLPTGIKKNLVDIVKYGQDVSDVYVIYDSNSVKSNFTSQLQAAGVSPSAVTWVNLENGQFWVRDYGPVPIVSTDGKVGMVDLRYYHQRIHDDAIPTKLGNLWNVTTYRAPLDFEGGNFMADTVGNCFASEGLLWYNGVGEAQLEEYFQDYLGCEELYIVKALQNEGTTHLDMQMKLTSDSTVIVGEYGYSQDQANYKITNDNAAFLQNLGYNVVRMPMPSNSDGNFRTYINSLFVSGVNMVPTYSIDKAKEAEALQIWAQVMPTWQHIPFNSDDVIALGGAIHCITMTTGTGSFSPIESKPGYACGGDWSCYPNSGQPTGCGGITYEGCCDGQLLKYCENNQLKTGNCGNDPQCGWDAQGGFYNCGTNGGSDPSGQNPKNCGGGCTANCAGKECGSDGCGGSCGQCAGNETCQAGTCVAGGDGCNGITYEGCCDGQTLKYCEDNQLITGTCAGDPQCGWDAQGGFYNCGTNGGSDPSGQNPKDCGGACTPDCAGKVCGDDGCGGACGQCGAGDKCVAGQCICHPVCTNKECGSDGCDGSCGTCPNGFACSGQGKCIGDCDPDCAGKVCGDDGCGGSCGSCGPGQLCQLGQCNDVTDPCLGITWEGCCDGGTLHFCETDVIQTLECGDAGCGWNGEQGYYDCNQAGGDPSGTNPKDCPGGQCIPNCADKMCGNDGCGGSCGTCAQGQYCDAGLCIGGSECGDVTYAGYCDGEVLVWCENGNLYDADCGQLPGTYKCLFAEPPGQEAGYYCVQQPDCTPDCAGKACGDDGCGGSCGACQQGESCIAGACAPGPCEPDCTALECGDDGCGGSCGVCPAGWQCENGQCATDCQPACAGKECGDDGCGGTCGTCPDGENCFLGHCTDKPCEADCTGKTCGNDGCEGSCGACGDNETCDDGACVPACLPDCVGRECGADGCGGSCGACDPGFSCQAGVCQEGCEADCNGLQCGDDGCGGLCGTCPAGQLCVAGQCKTDCTPDCEDRACGPDGCGGSCGNCPKNFSCDEGACVAAPDGCGNVDAVGMCEGQVLKKCVASQVITIDCSLTGKVCGFVPGAGVFDCVDQCIANCAGKECGNDGCGGNCGTCAKGFDCDAGACVESTVPCAGSCAGKVCGDDGCGNSCGECPASQSCQAGACVADEGPGDEDVVEGDATEVADAGETGGSKKSGGCTTGAGNSGSLFLLFAMMLALVGVRRFGWMR